MDDQRDSERDDEGANEPANDRAHERDDEVINVADGLPGFEQLRSWTLERPAPGAVFSLLRSVERPDVALPVAEPWTLVPGYEPQFPPADLAAVNLTCATDATVLVVAGIDVPAGTAWLNLAAPIVVNPGGACARQSILDRQGWPVRHPVALGA